MAVMSTVTNTNPLLPVTALGCVGSTQSCTCARAVQNTGLCDMEKDEGLSLGLRSSVLLSLIGALYN